VVPDIPDFCSELVVLGPHGDTEGQLSDQARKAFRGLGTDSKSRHIRREGLAARVRDAEPTFLS
jgi:hypothetical protein